MIFEDCANHPSKKPALSPLRGAQRRSNLCVIVDCFVAALLAKARGLVSLPNYRGTRSGAMWVERTKSEQLLSTVPTRPAILLTGARQSGKTSLLRRLFLDAEQITFDRVQYAQAAEENPQRFLQQHLGQSILDEVQYAPSLFNARSYYCSIPEREGFSFGEIRTADKYRSVLAVPQALWDSFQ